MEYGTRFHPDRLKEAREARGLFQTEVARQLKVTPGAVSQWENGHAVPSARHRRRLAEVLDVKEQFFSWNPAPAIQGPAFFRSFAAATKRERVGAERQSEWLSRLVRAVEERVELPDLVFPPDTGLRWQALAEADIEEQADRVREMWGLGKGPISNLVWLLEGKGVLVVRLAVESERLDAHSWWTSSGRPIIWLGSNKASAVRSRFDAAHELGHLILHRDVTRSEFRKSGVLKELEAQANRFASAFLMPAESFSREMREPSLEWFRTLKPRWKVAIAAMIYRVQDLGIVSERQATSLWKGRSARGWTKREPLDDELLPEQPRLLSSAFELLLNEGAAHQDELRDLVPLPEAEVERLAGLGDGFLSSGTRSVVSLESRRGRSRTHGVSPESTVIPFPSRGDDA